MGKKRVLKFDENVLKALDKCHKHHSCPMIRHRCWIVKLKLAGHTNVSIQAITKSSCPTVTRALDKYEFGYASLGIKCMENAAGQGRKAALQLCDAEMVRAEVIKERQKVSLAKEIISANKGTKLSDYQLNSFLKRLVGSTNE